MVKYRLPDVSITLAVYNPIQFNEEILFVDNKFAPVKEPPRAPPVIRLPAEIFPVYVANVVTILE